MAIILPVVSAIEKRRHLIKKRQSTAVLRGTANVFADLGFADAETHLLKAQLVTRIQRAIDAQKLTQVAAAKVMGLSHPDESGCLMDSSGICPLSG